MIEYLVAWLICILIGALIGAIIGGGKGRSIALFSMASAVVSAVFLVLIWAILTVSAFFGIPLVVIVAIIIIVWFLLGSIKK